MSQTGPEKKVTFAFLSVCKLSARLECVLIYGGLGAAPCLL